MAVKPLTQFPVHLEDFLEEKYCKYKGVRTITVRKATQGLGIMIIEGKRADVGRGVFVSDIQDGSPAENAGLSVGDMILCVNQTDLIGADYETSSNPFRFRTVKQMKAANVLKCADGLLTLIIAKPDCISLMIQLF
ncbi:multiple PDZ domain protein-like protein [Sarcoptes scabiei]|uniref:Multiple PDZ domain protein-like protein n=1 Tax=Sarcoptes scabiei TaxID=52283 RepID=A0A132A536_SARSC|nr:multiple PDZ domain protein-like protein [Sarcoptes scabiei]